MSAGGARRHAAEAVSEARKPGPRAPAGGSNRSRAREPAVVRPLFSPVRNAHTRAKRWRDGFADGVREHF